MENTGEVRINLMLEQQPASAGRKEGEEASRSDLASTFDELFRNHWNRVCNIVYRLVGDQDEAEDLAVEAFWKLYDRFQSGVPHDNTTGWLYRVATNLGYNALRANRRRQHYEEEAGKEFVGPSSGVNTAAEVESREERERVRLALKKIRPRSAQILLLKYSGFSYAEIASVVGVAPASVGTLLVRAEKEFENRFRALEGGQL